jgi:hypothetical protein
MPLARKFEARNSKQIRMIKTEENSKRTCRRAPAFRSLVFRISHLFRISNFEFRVFGLWLALLLLSLAGCGTPGEDRPASSGNADGRVAGASACGAEGLRPSPRRRDAFDTRGQDARDTTSRAADGRATIGKRVFLTVDFQKGQTLRYKFTSKKEIAVDWDPNAVASANRVQGQSEDCEMVVAYTPVEVDPYGVSTIRAVVESVHAERSGGPAARRFGTDAVETAQGKSFTLQVDPRGKIVDSSQLTALIQEMGKQAFRADTSGGRTKEPDMIGDFIAGQWFLWNAQASVERPADGLTVGQTWSSQLSVPTPMVMRRARNVVYKLDQIRGNAADSLWRGRPALASRGHPIRQTQGRLGLASSDQDASAAPGVQGQDALATAGQGQDALATGEQGRDALATGGAGPLAVIKSTYTLADAVPAGWPIPYSGRFQMSGTFGFLGPYEVLGLEGTGEELFNLKAGRIERRRETYTLRVRAGLPPIGIRANPHITIEQTLTMELQ